MLGTITLLGVKVSRVNLESAAKQICQWVQERASVYICVAPVSTLVEARGHPEYARIINAAGMVTPDGMPVVWLARAHGCAEVGRTYGPDLMRKMCRIPGLRHYFLGGTPEALIQLSENLNKEAPGINIVGMNAPPFRSQAGVEEEATRQAINSARPDILWVGLGSPKQDFWMSLNRTHLQVPVMIGVGAAFDFLAGSKTQAPVWIQRSGFEWLFRLCKEPRRLWKRYLIGNSMFIFYLIKDSFKRPACA